MFVADSRQRHMLLAWIDKGSMIASMLFWTRSGHLPLRRMLQNPMTLIKSCFNPCQKDTSHAVEHARRHEILAPLIFKNRLTKLYLQESFPFFVLFHYDKHILLHFQ
ncbi:hypothetical protein KP509_1Z058700 [Ceratopteris richardii]|nr:hypothetical protein KP509_1Z058700 [Ceratopteris richardii]